MSLFKQLINVDEKYKLLEWNLYFELIETKNNIENFNFYNWDIMKNDIRYYDILMYAKLDFEHNFNNIINIVEEFIIDNINNTNGYSYKNNKLNIEWWIKEDLIKCENCDNIWDGCAQCNCSI